MNTEKLTVSKFAKKHWITVLIVAVMLVLSVGLLIPAFSPVQSSIPNTGRWNPVAVSEFIFDAVQNERLQEGRIPRSAEELAICLSKWVEDTSLVFECRHEQPGVIRIQDAETSGEQCILFYTFDEDSYKVLTLDEYTHELLSNPHQPF